MTCKIAPLALGMGAIVLLGACETTAPNASAPKTSRAAQVETRIDEALEKTIAEAEKSGNKQEALAVYAQLSQIKPKDPALAVRYARALREDLQLKKAAKVLEPFIKAANPDPDALTERAMIHLNLGEYKDAELRARETITMRPENGRAFLALGTALDAQGYHEQAETAFRRGIEYWRGDPAPILNNLALNLASQGKLDEALNVLQRAKEASPHRMEIERNYRIISTLRETAGPIAPKPVHKPDVPKTFARPMDLKVKPAELSTIEVKATEALPPQDPKTENAEKPQNTMNEEQPDTRPESRNRRSVQKWKATN